MVKVREMIMLWESRIKSTNTLEKPLSENKTKSDLAVIRNKLISSDFIEQITCVDVEEKETKLIGEKVAQNVVKELMLQITYKYSVPEVLNIVNNMIDEMKKARIVISSNKSQPRNNKKRRKEIFKKPTTDLQTDTFSNDFLQPETIEKNDKADVKINTDTINVAKKKKKWLDKKRWETMSQFKDRLKRYLGK
ncbi:hypothetical protein CWI38_0070p0020 [Hamiltosporidium tvaerminnensis]|uniref:Uncharacterized protein n=1 Tax=Hamiltosporidium tvaerminnensis TaxID=1176355 RepID=A0A4Q9M172_9MICR|nr:hypothetical protein CWI38_0070p0020 [Hamiltosporidium tvaerminnensis]